MLLSFRSGVVRGLLDPLSPLIHGVAGGDRLPSGDEALHVAEFSIGGSSWSACPSIALNFWPTATRQAMVERLGLLARTRRPFSFIISSFGFSIFFTSFFDSYWG